MFRGIVIDDERWAIQNLVDTIAGQRWLSVLHEAYSGAEGIGMLEALRPEVAFIDVQMPGMSGLEVLRRARENGLNTKIIMVSDRAEFSYAKEAILYDASGYCLKPYSKRDVTECMEKVCRQLSVGGASAVRFSWVTENKLVIKMLEYITAHYQEDITVDSLAKVLSINANYAGQIFKRETGETIKQYTTRLRIEEAVNRLSYTGERVADIALDIGYKDYFYFSKVFKRLTGLTPSELRAARTPAELRMTMQ